MKEKDLNFRKEVYEQKVNEHVNCGYTKELAEWKVMKDYNREFLSPLGISPNKKETNSRGYYKG